LLEPVFPGVAGLRMRAAPGVGSGCHPAGAHPERRPYHRRPAPRL